MRPFVDVHSHVTPPLFPPVPNEAARGRWPCMQCSGGDDYTIMMGDAPFRKLDTRSWDVERRMADMDRDGVSLQVISPMPELLSYWLERDDAALICDSTNHFIAETVSRNPHRFRGLGAVPLQDPVAAAAVVPKLKSVFNLSGVEIGSNISGMMLGDRALDPFWEALQSESLAVFVHALHPIAAKPLSPSPLFTAAALFPMDVAMAAASMIIGGVLERFPALRIGFSHGGGALGSILGRLDIVYERSGGFGGVVTRRPSEQAAGLYFDSNVYDPDYLHFIATSMAPGQIFAGTDYPYDIMQKAPATFVSSLGLGFAELESISVGAASRFLAEDLRSPASQR
jgi:aminocarboxymuconate-semialdehyde decarboxylase